MNFTLLFSIVALALLIYCAPALAQKDTMKTQEKLTAVVIKPEHKPEKSDELKTKEALSIEVMKGEKK